MFGLFILTFLIPKIFCFNEKEIDIVTALNQQLMIKQCILSTVVQDQNFNSHLKNISEKKIFSAYLNFSKLCENFLEYNEFHVKTIIVLKAYDNVQLSYILKELKSKALYTDNCHLYTWLLILPSNPIDITENNFHVPFNCEFFLISKNDDHSTIFEIYQIKASFNMLKNHFGDYYNKSSFSFNNKYLYQRRNNLHGSTFIVKIRDEGPCKFKAECLRYEYLIDTSNMLNYTVKALKEKDFLLNPSIVPDSNNLAEVVRIITDKNPKYKFIGPILRSKVHLYIRDIGRAENYWNVYLKPFEKELWIAIITWISISTITFISIGWIGLKWLNLNGYDLLDHGLAPLSVLCNQGLNEKPKNISSRIAKIAIFITSIFILPGYSAFIISFITVDKTVIPFTDFESFIKDGTYKLTFIAFNFVTSFFQDGKDPVIQKIRNEYLTDYNPQSHEEAINMICSQPKLSVINFNYQMFKRWAPCKMIIVSKTLFPVHGAIELDNEAMQYEKLFYETLVKSRSAGLIYIMEKKLYEWIETTPIKTFKPIKIETTLSIILLLASGVFLSTLFLITEIIYHRLMNSYKKTKNTRQPK